MGEWWNGVWWGEQRIGKYSIIPYKDEDLPIRGYIKGWPYRVNPSFDPSRCRHLAPKNQCALCLGQDQLRQVWDSEWYRLQFSYSNKIKISEPSKKFWNESPTFFFDCLLSPGVHLINRPSQTTWVVDTVYSQTLDNKWPEQKIEWLLKQKTEHQCTLRTVPKKDLFPYLGLLVPGPKEDFEYNPVTDEVKLPHSVCYNRLGDYPELKRAIEENWGVKHRPWCWDFRGIFKKKGKYYWRFYKRQLRESDEWTVADRPKSRVCYRDTNLIRTLERWKATGKWQHKEELPVVKFSRHFGSEYGTRVNRVHDETQVYFLDERERPDCKITMRYRLRGAGWNWYFEPIELSHKPISEFDRKCFFHCLHPERYCLDPKWTVSEPVKMRLEDKRPWLPDKHYNYPLRITEYRYLKNLTFPTWESFRNKYRGILTEPTGKPMTLFHYPPMWFEKFFFTFPLTKLSRQRILDEIGRSYIRPSGVADYGDIEDFDKSKVQDIDDEFQQTNEDMEDWGYQLNVFPSVHSFDYWHGSHDDPQDHATVRKKHIPVPDQTEDRLIRAIDTDFRRLPVQDKVGILYFERKLSVSEIAKRLNKKIGNVSRIITKLSSIKALETLRNRAIQIGIFATFGAIYERGMKVKKTTRKIVLKMDAETYKLFEDFKVEQGINKRDHKQAFSQLLQMGILAAQFYKESDQRLKDLEVENHQLGEKVEILTQQTDALSTYREKEEAFMKEVVIGWQQERKELENMNRIYEGMIDPARIEMVKKARANDKQKRLERLERIRKGVESAWEPNDEPLVYEEINL